MSTEEERQGGENSSVEEQPPKFKKGRKTYSPPVVEELGDLRALTLGGSPGTGDSGPTEPFANPKV